MVSSSGLASHGSEAWKIFILDLSLDGDWAAQLRTMVFPLDPPQGEPAWTVFRPEKDHPCASAPLVSAFSRCAPSMALALVEGSHWDQVLPWLQFLKEAELSHRFLLCVREKRDLPWDCLLDLAMGDLALAPFDRAEMVSRLRRLAVRVKHPQLLSDLKTKFALRSMVGRGEAFLKQLELIPKVASLDVHVLISGETGTGKELCARALHYSGNRAGKPFIAMNCGAIPVELFENELFGHIAGSFTGASAKHRGLIEAAEGGTLFLDEVDCLPAANQIKLLRFLQEKEYRPLGVSQSRHADVRIVAAASDMLSLRVQNGEFRQDLYFRLNAMPIQLPPLRERQEDIPLLAEHFLAQFTAAYQKPIRGISPKVIQQFLLHPWPGNVRELEQTIQRAVLLAEDTVIRERDIMLGGRRPESVQNFNQAKQDLVRDFERRYLRGLLTSCHGNVTQASVAAGKHRRALWELIRKHGIEIDEFRRAAIAPTAALPAPQGKTGPRVRV